MLVESAMTILHPYVVQDCNKNEHGKMIAKEEKLKLIGPGVGWETEMSEEQSAGRKASADTFINYGLDKTRNDWKTETPPGADLRGENRSRTHV